MEANKIETRLAAIEQDLALLKSRVLSPYGPNEWIERIAGTFSKPQDRAAFDEAMRYGREWRQAQRPKPRKRRITAKK